VNAIANTLPNGLNNKQAVLKEWLPIAKDANTWQEYIEIFFESWKTTGEHDDEPNGEEDEDEDNENDENDPAHPEDIPRDTPHAKSPRDCPGGTPHPKTPKHPVHCTYTMQKYRTLDTIISISNT
jgi:hypothetical protein